MITIKELAFFLIEKEEHYPLSDEFITRHQQRGGGYIDFAIQTGHPVDKKRCEPNQKWHFFESWLIPNIKKGVIKSMDDDANKVFYHNRVKCPELLLWFLEAVGVNASDVEAAKKIAEDGKINNTNVGTIAKEIREQVSWEIIETAIKA